VSIHRVGLVGASAGGRAVPARVARRPPRAPGLACGPAGSPRPPQTGPVLRSMISANGDTSCRGAAQVPIPLIAPRFQGWPEVTTGPQPVALHATAVASSRTGVPPRRGRLRVRHPAVPGGAFRGTHSGPRLSHRAGPARLGLRVEMKPDPCDQRNDHQVQLEHCYSHRRFTVTPDEPPVGSTNDGTSAHPQHEPGPRHQDERCHQ
jgi:hypothetical protein